jgi:hypothetical protein
MSSYFEQGRCGTCLLLQSGLEAWAVSECSCRFDGARPPCPAIRMNPILLCAVGFCCLSCYGQTNASTIASSRFFLPPIQLRTETRPSDGEPKKSAPEPGVSFPSSQPITLEAALGDAGLHSSVVRSGEFYLTRPEPPSESGVVRFVEGVFKPEVIQVGKTSVSCSVLTAIKRKNPLCLLNPIFFGVSW